MTNHRQEENAIATLFFNGFVLIEEEVDAGGNLLPWNRPSSRLPQKTLKPHEMITLAEEIG